MQLVTMAATCSAVLVLLLIKQAFGEPVMYLPPLEVRSLDMNTKMPFFDSQFFSGNQRFISSAQPAMSPVQQPPMEQPPMQQPSMQQPPMQQLPIKQPLMQQPPIQQPLMQQPPMQPHHMSSTAMSQPMLQPSIHHRPKLFHHTAIQTTPVMGFETDREKPFNRPNMTFSEFVDVMNDIREHTNNDNSEEESPEARASSNGYSAPASSYPSTPAYSRPYSPPPTRPNYGSYAPPPPAPAYQEPAYAPAPHHVNIGKTDLFSSLLSPKKDKIGGKLSGLAGIVLSLLGGGPGLQIGSFKDILIDGIIKPLLIAKGGIKALISKLAIPVISLVLINLEVLITVWWLWEECPKATPSYSAPETPAYGGSSY